jgi:hypothetical protein
MKYLAIILLMILAGCTEEPEVIPYDYTRVFTGDDKKGWSIRSYQYLEEGKAPQTGRLPDCLSDDVYIFFANEERRMEIRDSDEKCVPEDPDLLTEGTWGFSNTSATLSLPFPLLADPLVFGAVPFIVRDADEDSMTLEIFFGEENEFSYRFSFRAENIE